MHTNNLHDPLRPHRHEPNFNIPSEKTSFVFSAPFGHERIITVDQLRTLPKSTIQNCFIVSTGHGTSGPFAFGGVRLLDLIQSEIEANIIWLQVEVISADGFGNRILAEELYNGAGAGEILLCYEMDGVAMTRRQGLIRLIVPSEKDDALRQVKWVERVKVRGE